MSFQDRISATITASVADGIGRIVISNPGRRNAVDLAGWRRLASLVPDLAATEGVRVLVIGGASDDFCAGADISEFGTVRRDAATARVYEQANSDAFAALRHCAVPVIASIRGVCYGGGLGLAAACDLRLATPDARFAVPAAKLGLAYPADAMGDIVRAAGDQLARYLTLTAQPIDAIQAFQAGFLLRVAEPGELDATVEAIARAIAANAPLSVLASRLAIAATTASDPAMAARAVAIGDRTFDSADYAEGRAAFGERRAPRFTGR